MATFVNGILIVIGCLVIAYGFTIHTQSAMHQIYQVLTIILGAIFFGFGYLGNFLNGLVENKTQMDSSSEEDGGK